MPSPSLPPPAGDQRMRRGDRVVHRDLPDGVLVLAPGMDEPLAITGPAASLWHLLADRPTREEVATELARVHGTTEDRVAADLDPLWVELEAHGLVAPAIAPTDDPHAATAP